jgi:uncharacterized membrane protein YhaH (DUF805 family)
MGGADPGERLVDGLGAFPLIAVAREGSGGGGPMNFPQAIASGFKKYAVFSGRASRSEYWYWMLFYAVGNIATSILDAIVFRSSDPQAFSAIFGLAIFLPSVAVEVRRLHDVDRSGWWLLIYLTIIGMIYPLLVWKCRKGTVGPNRFGEDPFGLDWVVSQFE